jgi:hypothetical protein
MRLKYVGPMPNVSARGVAFDVNKPDKWTFLSAALELAEAFDFQNEKSEGDRVYRPKGQQFSESEMLDRLHRYCDDLESYVKDRETKARALVDELRKKVESSKTISDENRRAWLNNIDAMYDYYLQYVTNESAYQCVLETIAKEVKAARIEEIRVPLFQNFGIVLRDLVDVLENGRPPIDAELSIVKEGNDIFGVMRLRHA